MRCYNCIHSFQFAFLPLELFLKIHGKRTSKTGRRILSVKKGLEQVSKIMTFSFFIKGSVILQWLVSALNDYVSIILNINDIAQALCWLNRRKKCKISAKYLAYSRTRNLSDQNKAGEEPGEREGKGELDAGGGGGWCGGGGEVGEVKQYNCNFFVFTHKGNKALYERQYPESRDLLCTILSEKQKLIHASTFLLKKWPFCTCV